MLLRVSSSKICLKDRRSTKRYAMPRLSHPYIPIATRMYVTRSYEVERRKKDLINLARDIEHDFAELRDIAERNGADKKYLLEIQRTAMRLEPHLRHKFMKLESSILDNRSFLEELNGIEEEFQSLGESVREPVKVFKSSVQSSLEKLKDDIAPVQEEIVVRITHFNDEELDEIRDRTSSASVTDTNIDGAEKVEERKIQYKKNPPYESGDQMHPKKVGLNKEATKGKVEYKERDETLKKGKGTADYIRSEMDDREMQQTAERMKQDQTKGDKDSLLSKKGVWGIHMRYVIEDKEHDASETIERAAQGLTKKVVDTAKEVKENIEHHGEPIVEKAKDVKDTVMDKAQDVKEGLQQAEENIGNRVEDVNEAGKENVKRIAESIIETAAHMRDSIEEKLGILHEGHKGTMETEEGVKHPMSERVVEGVKKTVHDVTERVKDMTEDLTTMEAHHIHKSSRDSDFEKAHHDLQEHVMDKAQDVKEDVKGKVQGVKEDVKGKVQDVKEGVMDTGSRIKDTAKSMKDDIVGKEGVVHDIVEGIENVKEKVTPAAQNIKEKIEEVAENASNKVEDVKERMKETGKHMKKEATLKKDQVKEEVRHKTKGMKHKAQEKKEDVRHKGAEMKRKAKEEVKNKRESA